MPSPSRATRAPPIAGPTSRAELNIVELSAIAFARSSRPPTIWTRKDCRTGTSTECTRPRKKLRATTCQTVTRPVSTSAERTRAWTRERLCVARIIRWRFRRSAHTPATGERTRLGAWPAKPTRPSRNAEPVSRYTSQPSATCCIQVPTRETIWPPRNSRKLRWRKARKPPRRRSEARLTPPSYRRGAVFGRLLDRVAGPPHPVARGESDEAKGRHPESGHRLVGGGGRRPRPRGGRGRKARGPRAERARRHRPARHGAGRDRALPRDGPARHPLRLDLRARGRHAGDALSRRRRALRRPVRRRQPRAQGDDEPHRPARAQPLDGRGREEGLRVHRRPARRAREERAARRAAGAGHPVPGDPVADLPLPPRAPRLLG